MTSQPTIGMFILNIFKAGSTMYDIKDYLTNDIHENSATIYNFLHDQSEFPQVSDNKTFSLIESKRIDEETKSFEFVTVALCYDNTADLSDDEKNSINKYRNDNPHVLTNENITFIVSNLYYTPPPAKSKSARNG